MGDENFHPSQDPLVIHQKIPFLSVSPRKEDFHLESFKNSPFSPEKIPRNNALISPVVQRSNSSRYDSHLRNRGLGSYLASPPGGLDSSSGGLLSSARGYHARTAPAATYPDSQMMTTQELGLFHSGSLRHSSKPFTAASPSARHSTPNTFARYQAALMARGARRGDRPLTGAGAAARHAFAHAALREGGRGGGGDGGRRAPPKGGGAAAAGAAAPLDQGSLGDLLAWSGRDFRHRLARLELDAAPEPTAARRTREFSRQRRGAPAAAVDRDDFPEYHCPEKPNNQQKSPEQGAKGSIFDGDWQEADAARRRARRATVEAHPAARLYRRRRAYFEELQERRLKGHDGVLVKDRGDAAARDNLLYAKKVAFVLDMRVRNKKKCLTKWKQYHSMVHLFRRIFLYYKGLRETCIQAWYKYAKAKRRIKLMMLESMMGPLRKTFKAWKGYWGVMSGARTLLLRQDNRLLDQVCRALRAYADERLAVKRRLARNTMFSLTRSTFEAWKGWLGELRARRARAMGSLLSGPAKVFHHWKQLWKQARGRRLVVEKRRLRAKRGVFDNWKYWSSLAKKRRRELIFLSTGGVQQQR